MNFVDEQNARDQFRHPCIVLKTHTQTFTLVDVSVYDFVDFLTELVRNFRFLRFHHLTENGSDVMSSLWSSVGRIQIMERDVLHDFFLFVNVSLKRSVIH